MLPADVAAVVRLDVPAMAELTDLPRGQLGSGRFGDLSGAQRLCDAAGGRLQLMSADRLAEPDPTAPLLVYGLPVHAESLDVVLRQYPGDHEVVLVAGPVGSPSEERVTAEELRRGRALSAGAALFVPGLPAERARASPHGLRDIVHRLRAPGGCPWDREQTPSSLIKFVLEEAYEVADAIEHKTADDVREELGDLLLQVYLQAEIAEEHGDFDLTEVIRGLAEKLIRRHPHVFGTVKVNSASEVEQNWEVLKRAEQPTARSVLDKVPLSLPALARAREMQRRMSKAGFDWPDQRGALEKLDEELGELRGVLDDRERMSEELGDVLFMMVKVAADREVDAEAALRSALRRIAGRFRYLERVAADRSVELQSLGLPELQELWRQAKSHELVAQDG